MPPTCPVCGAEHAACGPARPTRFIPLGMPHGGEPNPEYDVWLAEHPAEESAMLLETRAAQARRGDFTAKERLFLDAEGNVVSETDPNRNSLLVGKGGIVSAVDVERFNIRDRVTPYGEEEAAPADTPEPMAEGDLMTDAPTPEGEQNEADAEGEITDADFEGKTKAELLTLADERGVEVPSGATKAEIIAALQHRDE